MHQSSRMYPTFVVPRSREREQAQLRAQQRVSSTITSACSHASFHLGTGHEYTALQMLGIRYGSSNASRKSNHFMSQHRDTLYDSVNHKHVYMEAQCSINSLTVQKLKPENISFKGNLKFAITKIFKC